MSVVIVAAIAVVMFIVNRLLRRAENSGAFDPQAPSAASRPGLRMLLDYGPQGFGRDGIRQTRVRS